MRKTLWERVIQIIIPYKGRLGVSMVTLLALTALGWASPIWAPKLIGRALPDGDRQLFLQCVIVLLVIHLASSGLSYLYSYQMRILGGRGVFDLRRRMYDHLQRLSLGFYESRSAGEIISRMMNDVNAVTSLVAGTALHTLISSFKPCWLYFFTTVQKLHL